MIGYPILTRRKTMQRVQGNTLHSDRGAPRLPRLRLLLAAFAAAGVGLAHQAQSAGVPYTKDGTTTYRVINLAPGLLAELPDLNARGQVSFSMQDSPGATGYFYDGSVLRTIGTPGGDVHAVDLNDAGQVAGSFITGPGAQPGFVWSAAGGLLDIGVVPGAGESQAWAINNAGVVTGNSDGVPLFPPRAFRWSLATGIEDLGSLTPDFAHSSFGSALNEAGVIAGESDTPDYHRHAFTWTRTGGLVDIEPLTTYDSLVVAVGAKGEVAGNYVGPASGFLYHPFLWTTATGLVDLGTLGGTEAFVLSMTPDLQIAGLIDTPDGYQRAMSWTRAAGMRNLGTLGGLSSRAIDINTRGQIVGYSLNGVGDSRGFVWTAKAGMVDLNSRLRAAPPGLVVDDALSINDSGAIVASSNAGLVLLKPDTGPCGCSGLVLGPVAAPAIIGTGGPLQASLAFVDEERVGARRVDWSWGDGTPVQAGTVSASGNAGKASASHSFAAPGMYTVTATVVDGSGHSTAVRHEVVVTGESGGMVAGAGAVLSPAGAFARQPAYAGKARFRLLAPTAAAGGTASTAANTAGRLHFDLPGLNFRSQDVRLQGVDGAAHVFTGTGALRGAGGYQFRLTTAPAVAASEPGRFALKIWHMDPVKKVDVVDYDNARGVSGAAAVRVTKGSIVTQ
jgi:probable HAF family extracellular repeat protein